MTILNLLVSGVRLISFGIVFVFLFFSCTGKKIERELPLGQNNAVWAESIYLRGYKPSTGELLKSGHIIRLAKQLKENDIKYVFLFAGPYGVDGHLPAYPFSPTAIKSVRLLRQFYSDLTILPWIGGIENRTVHLGDSVWVKNALMDTKRLTEVLGCDGVHIDFEFIVDFDSSAVNSEVDFENYGKNVNGFHKKLRDSLPKAFISSVVVSTSVLGRPWKRRTTIPELVELTKYVDQLNFLFYDTRITDQDIFEQSCIELLRDIKFLRKKGRNSVQYLISVGTFVNQPELQHYRDLEIENISNTISTIKKSLVSVDTSKQIIDGLSIYCQWETDQREWNEFRNNWARQN